MTGVSDIVIVDNRLITIETEKRNNGQITFLYLPYRAVEERAMSTENWYRSDFTLYYTLAIEP